MYSNDDYKKYLKTFTDQNVRSDGRPMHHARETTFLRGVLTRNTYGSALIRMGNTRVVAAVTLSVGRPTAASPNYGEVDVSVTMGPLCSPLLGPSGRPTTLPTMTLASAEGINSNYSSNGKTSMPTEASVLESFLRRTLLQSGILQLSDLCIQEGKSAWKILISIVCLNHDGNMEDAAFLSAVTALSNTQLPRIVISSQGVVYLKDVDDNRDNTTNNTTKLVWDTFDESKLKLQCIPVPLSIGMFDGKLLVDPSGEEELVLDGILTLIVTSQGQVVSINKPGGAFISSEDLAACLTLATSRAKEIEDAIFKL